MCNAASLRETGSVARYTPRGLAAMQCVVSMLSLMAPRVCTLVLSSIKLSFCSHCQIFFLLHLAQIQKRQKMVAQH